MSTSPSARHLPQTYILNLSCPDTIGIVASVAQFLSAAGCSITESNHFNDGLEDAFYMRTVFKAHKGALAPVAEVAAAFEPIATKFNMRWQLYDASVRPKMMIAVSKFGHCLFDLLHRWKAGTLHADVVGVVSNHDDMRSFVEWNQIPFHHLPVTSATRGAQEKRVLELMRTHDVELLALARYMQVLSPEMCAALSQRCINIHHSFLPSFRGAKPYHQAYARGVKIIGATAHYVTGELDEGPIIEQAVERVSHTHNPEDLVEVGRDLECAVMARAVRWHLERRIMVVGQRTVVFR